MVSHTIAHLCAWLQRKAPGQVYFTGSEIKVPHALPLCSDRLCPCLQVSSAPAHLLPTMDLLGLLSPFMGLCCRILSGGITEWFELEGTLKITYFLSSCHRQGHLVLHQVAENLIQPGLEHLQLTTYIYNFSRLPVSVPHYPPYKEILPNI